MKRYLVIPLMFLYLLALSGVTVNAHYCGKQLVSWNVYLKAGDCDGCADMGKKPKPPKCCKDKVVAAKVDHDQHHVSLKFQLGDVSFLPAPAPQVFYSSIDIIPVAITTTANRANAPPGLWQQIPLYKLHARFTYYG